MGSQALTFRLNYGETISGGELETATRLGFVLGGWYTDPEFTQPFRFETPVTPGLPGVETDYQTSSRWAATRILYGDDDEGHANVRNIMHLYAKWVPDTNVNGIKVIYDIGEAGVYDSMGGLLSTVPVDSLLYQPGSQAIVGAPPEDYNELYVFDYWVVVDEEGNEIELRDNEGNLIRLKHNTVFSVDLEDNQYFSITYNQAREPLLRTIKLRAKYHPSDQASLYTTIIYDGNKFDEILYTGGSETIHGKAKDGSDRLTITLDTRINDTIILPGTDDFYLNGYELVGWSFFQGSYADQIAAEDEYNSTAQPEDRVTHFAPEAKVAADQMAKNSVNDEQNTLYAMWQPKTYTVTVKQVVEEGISPTSYSYRYRSGVERSIPNSYSSLTLGGNDQEDYTNLSPNNTSEKFQYYGRVGHAFQIYRTTAVPNNAFCRVTAWVTKDDGTRVQLEPQTVGNYSSYQILGDVEIIYTYALKVYVRLVKRDLQNNNELNDSTFTLTPMEWDAISNKWVAIQGGTVETISPTGTKQLMEGVYLVEEIQTPPGYASMGDALLLTVNKTNPTIALTNGGTVSNEFAVLAEGSDATRQSTPHVLTIYNRPIRTITVRKVVSGTNVLPEGEKYKFSAMITLDGVAMKNFDTGSSNNPDEITNAGGVIEFYLAQNEPKSILVPWHAELTLTENKYTQFEVTTASQNNVSDLDDRAEVYRCMVENNDTITFTNTNHPLTVKKTVTGDMGDRTLPFSFTLSGLQSGSKYYYTVNSVPTNATVTNEGRISFTLSHGQTMVIPLPVGNYWISETPVEYYTTSIAVNGGEPVQVEAEGLEREIKISSADTNVMVEFINDRVAISPTGVVMRVAPYAVMLIVGVALAAVAIRGSRRNKKDDD